MSCRLSTLLVSLALLTVAPVLLAAPVTSAGKSLQLTLDPDAGAVTGLKHAASAFDFLQGQPEAKRYLWELTVRTPAGPQYRLRPEHARQCTTSRQGETLTLNWTGVGSKECPADLTVTATVRQAAGEARSRWEIAVQGSAPGVLWQVDFPRLVGLRPVGEDRLALPIYAGRLVRDPAKRGYRVTMNYPAPASMQFLATWGTPDSREPALPAEEGRKAETGWAPDRSDATGLYFATEDPAGYVKNFVVDGTLAPGTLSLWAENFPGLATWPLDRAQKTFKLDYKLPYPVVVAGFTGDYLEAARLYLDFARTAPWCRRGPADQWPTATPPAGSEALAQWVPTWFREAGFWAKFYHEPAKVVPEWAAYEKWLRVPISSHYYRYNIAIFDDNYNDMLPGDPYLLPGIRDARDLGISPMPYVNGVIWDTGTQSWIRESGLRAALKNEAGDFYPWIIGDRVFAYMCPYTEQWRANLRNAASELVGEHGMTGLYLDCLTATMAHKCYDPTHGHTLRGGNYYFMGQRQLMHDLRAASRAYDPQSAYFCEQIGEWVMDDMDGYLTLDLQRAPTPGAQLLPLYAAAYHPYTIHFGSDATLGHERNLFAWEMGEMLTWGSQPLHSTFAPPLPKGGDPNSELLREVVQAYYQVGQRFLQGGTLERLAIRPPAGKPGSTGWELACPPHEVAYEFSKTDQRLWSGPAILGSAWARQGDHAVVLMNLTDQPQEAELTLRPEKLGMKATARLVRAWPLPATVEPTAAGSHRLTLEPGRVLILVLTEDVARASQTRPLLDTPWELVTTKDGPLPAVTGPAGSLWACSDGPVGNDHTGAGTKATLLGFDAEKGLAPRQGHEAKVTGAAAEGQALPRETDRKPFALLRRLPFTVTGNTDDTLVLSGDEAHLCAIMPGGTTVRFGARGLTVVTDATTGRVTQPLTWTDTLKLPPGPANFVLGYARFTTEGLERSLQAAPSAKGKLAALLQALAPFVSEKPVTDTQLARADEALLAVETSLGDLPAALLPERPLLAVHRGLQALTTARVGAGLWLTSEHDWLAAGLAKPLTVQALCCGNELTALKQLALTPVGGWAADKVTVRPAQLVNTGNGVRQYSGEMTLQDGTYAERVVPVVATARVAAGGATFPLLALTYLEANRPFEIQGPTEAVTLAAGHGTSVKLTLRNWSPYALRLALSAETPAGWEVKPEAATVVVAAATNVTTTVTLTPPENAPQAGQDITLTARHGAADTAVYFRLPVQVQPKLVPLVAEAAQWPQPTASPALRQSNTMLLYAAAGETLNVKLNNVRVTRYTNALTYRLTGPGLQTVKEGTVAVDQSTAVNLPAPETGTYTLSLQSQSGSVTVECANRVCAELATAATPLNVYCSPLTRYFYVPAGAKEFRLGAFDGGPDEGARFVVTSPTGRKAFDFDGNYLGAENPITVAPDEAGKVWKLELTPRQDIKFWLAGDVCSYLSTAPERVLVEANRKP